MEFDLNSIFPMTKFKGFLNFDGYDAVIANCVERVGPTNLDLDLTENRGENGDFPVRFRGIAQKTGNGIYQTGWVFLTSPEGVKLTGDDEVRTQIVLTSVTSPNGVELVVQGFWTDKGSEAIEFRGRLSSID